MKMVVTKPYYDLNENLDMVAIGRLHKFLLLTLKCKWLKHNMSITNHVLKTR